MRGQEWPKVNLYSAVVAGEDTTIAGLNKEDTSVDVVAGGNTTVAVLAGWDSTVAVVAGSTVQYSSSSCTDFLKANFFA